MVRESEGGTHGHKKVKPWSTGDVGRMRATRFLLPPHRTELRLDAETLRTNLDCSSALSSNIYYSPSQDDREAFH